MARRARPNLFDHLVAVREQRCQNVQEFIGHWAPEKDAVVRYARWRQPKSAILESGRVDYQRGNQRPSSTALAKVRFLSVVCAKLRAEVITVSRPPNFNRTEWLVAERAAAGAAVHEIPAARDHQIAPPSEKTTRGLWHPTATYFNDKWQRIRIMQTVAKIPQLRWLHIAAPWRV